MLSLVAFFKVTMEGEVRNGGSKWFCAQNLSLKVN